MAKEIKIASDLDEIKRKGNVFECDFNGMHIKWCIAYDCKELGISDEANLKKWLQNAIGMSGKMWQVPWVLNKQLPFPSTVYVNDKEVDYPKE